MPNYTRRQILSASAITIAAGPLALLSQRAAVAADAAKLDPNDPQALALSYVHESAKPQNICGNCQLYTGDAAAWGPCAIFPGKQVATAGWCSAWVKKSG